MNAESTWPASALSTAHAGVLSRQPGPRAPGRAGRPAPPRDRSRAGDRPLRARRAASRPSWSRRCGSDAAWAFLASRLLDLHQRLDRLFVGHVQHLTLPEHPQQRIARGLAGQVPLFEEPVIDRLLEHLREPLAQTADDRGLMPSQAVGVRVREQELRGFRLVEERRADPLQLLDGIVRQRDRDRSASRHPSPSAVPRGSPTARPQAPAACRPPRCAAGGTPPWQRTRTSRSARVGWPSGRRGARHPSPGDSTSVVTAASASSAIRSASSPPVTSLMRHPGARRAPRRAGRWCSPPPAPPACRSR